MEGALRPKAGQNPSGVQLIEVIIGGLVFFLVAFFVLNLLPSSQWAVKKAENRLAAESLAYSTLELMRAQPFKRLVIETRPVSTVTRNGISYEISVVIQRIDGADPALVKEVVIRVSWREKGGERQSVASSYISRIRR